MKTLICDPSPGQLDFIYGYVFDFFDSFGVDCVSFKFASGSNMIDYMKSANETVDIILMSADITDVSGIDSALHIKNTYPEIKLILMSGETDIIEKIFEIGILYFLFTPVKLDSLNRCLKKVYSQIRLEKARYLQINNKQEIVHIHLNDICYIMSDKRKIVVREESGIESETYMKLDDVTEKLDGRFMRCHQSYLVNMDKIKQLTPEGFFLEDNIFVPVSQKKYYPTKHQYMEYIRLKIQGAQNGNE